MFMLLSNVVEVDISDWIIVTISQVKKEVLRAIKIYPTLFVRIMSRHLVWL